MIRTMLRFFGLALAVDNDQLAADLIDERFAHERTKAHMRAALRLAGDTTDAAIREHIYGARN